MPQIIVHDKATADVHEIAAYIAERNLMAGVRFYDIAKQAFLFLADMPGAGTRLEPPVAKWPNLRFWPMKYRKYLVLYQPINDGIEVLRVIHGMREIRRAVERG